MELRWEPMAHYAPQILCLRWCDHELARVQLRVDRSTWCSEVARHRESGRRRLTVIAPTQRTAMKWAERWTRAHLPRLLQELPVLHRTHCGTMSTAAPGPAHY
jgi:hypothetical protein